MKHIGLKINQVKRLLKYDSNLIRLKNRHIDFTFSKHDNKIKSFYNPTTTCPYSKRCIRTMDKTTDNTYLRMMLVDCVTY